MANRPPAPPESEDALLRQLQQTGEGLAGIDRVEEDALALRHQSDGGVPGIGGDRITGPAHIAQEIVRRRDLRRDLQQVGRLAHEGGRDFVKGIGVDHHPVDACSGQIQLGAERETCHRPAAALRADDVVNVQPLSGDLPGTFHIPQRAERIRPAAGDLVIRPAHRPADPVHLRVDVGVIIGVDKADLRSHQCFEQLIAHTVGHAALLEHQDGLHAQLSRSGGGEHGVVGLGAAGRENDLGTLRLRVGEEEFKLSHLVPAETDPGQIIALDVDVPAEEPADVLHLVNGRWENAERDPREAFDRFHECSPSFNRRGTAQSRRAFRIRCPKARGDPAIHSGCTSPPSRERRRRSRHIR